MSHENPESAKIFLNLEDASESNAMSTDQGGDFDHDQPAAPMRPQSATSSNSVASGPALVALIAILGGGSIFGMRVVSKHAAIAAENFVLDYQESAVGTDFDKRFETTMVDLERSTRPVQVPMAYLQRDPFNFYGGEVLKPVQVAQVEDPLAAEERDRLRREALAQALVAERERQDRAAMTKALGGYQLQSTLQGSNPVARISGEIVRIGGTLSYEITRGKDEQPDTGTFTVEAIGGRSVVMAAQDGSRYELAIGMPFRELESVVEAEDVPVEEAPVVAPVDEFAAAAAAAGAGADADTKPATEADTEANSDSDTGTDTDAASETDAASQGTAGAEPAELTFMERLQAASDALKQSEGSEPSAEGDAETEAVAEAVPVDTDAGAEADTETEAPTDAEAEGEAVADSDSDSGTETDTETGTNAETDAETGAETETGVEDASGGVTEGSATGETAGTAEDVEGSDVETGEVEEASSDDVDGSEEEAGAPADEPGDDESGEPSDEGSDDEGGR